jgi:transposase
MRPPYSNRRHSTEFKQKVCTEIRSGVVGRREAQRLYRLSDNLIHAWLSRFDTAARTPVTQVVGATASAAQHETFAGKIAALERKVGQLTMALEEHRPPRRPRR